MTINPYVPATAVGNGTQVDFSFTFPYLNQLHVKASINGALTTAFTFLSSNILRFNTAPANGTTVRIFRETPGDTLAAVIQPGGPLPIVGLNNNSLQSLYYNQETRYDAANQSTAGLQAQINGITSTAEAALTAAGAAETTANGIEATAVAALSDSAMAIATADAALLAADSAETVASSAETLASDALTAANAAVTVAELTDGLQEVRLPAGAVQYFAGSTAPTGWLKANGAAISRATYADLFTAIGTEFGAGNGSTTFNVPDLRGEFLRGWDDGRSVDSGRAFASAQTDAMQGHFHQFFSSNASDGGSGSAERWESAGNFTRNISGRGGVQAPITDGANGTPRTAAETRPRNVALLVCIKY